MAATFVELWCAALPPSLRIIAFAANEAMNALSSWQVRILVTDGSSIDPEAALGSPVALRIVDPEEGTSRDVGLIVTDLSREEDGRDGAEYTVELGPAEALLSWRSGYRVFLDKTTKEIVA